ncbi:MAG: hypothetical protein U5L06_07020 [Rhodovibrio sp.]|nr:hypothetical protein [Rhodovibrio sp.]
MTSAVVGAVPLFSNVTKSAPPPVVKFAIWLPPASMVPLPTVKLPPPAMLNTSAATPPPLRWINSVAPA